MARPEELVGDDMRVLISSVIVVTLFSSIGLYAQDAATNDLKGINDLKGKIFDAKMAQQQFANALKFCNELNGTNFYFAQRNRVLDLDEYHQSLESLAKTKVFNAETRKPWSDEEAAARWAQAQKQAATDKANCELVTSLPQLEKQLDELQKKAAASVKQN